MGLLEASTIVNILIVQVHILTTSRIQVLCPSENYQYTPLPPPKSFGGSAYILYHSRAMCSLKHVVIRMSIWGPTLLTLVLHVSFYRFVCHNLRGLIGPRSGQTLVFMIDSLRFIGLCRRLGKFSQSHSYIVVNLASFYSSYLLTFFLGHCILPLVRHIFNVMCSCK